VEATRTPPPGAPTFIPNNSTPPGDYVDPHVELCTTSNPVTVGQEFAVAAEAIDIGMPYFTFNVRDGGSGEFESLVWARTDVTVFPEVSEMLEFVRLERASPYVNEASFVFVARQAGIIDVRVSASGEVHYGYLGPAMWAGGGSDVLRIEVFAAE
jgi:hypothetical protein